MSYYVLKGTEDKKGPYTADELMQLLAKGEVTEETVVEQAETGALRSVREVLGGTEVQAPPVNEDVVVVPTAQKPKNSQGMLVGIIIAAVALCACVPLIGAILFPVFSQAGLAAKRTEAVAKLKEASTAMLIYAADYDGYFPPVMEETADVQGVLAEYLKSEDVWDVSDFGPEQIQTNPHLAGANSYDVEFPNRTVLFFYTPQSFRGKAVVSFVDGSAKVLDAEPLISHLFTDDFVLPASMMSD
ncbi:hypothetical protein QPK87_31865 [Kamptonema cortianum]|nr:hypothetical protein [Kamptonema cortianum]